MQEVTEPTAQVNPKVKEPLSKPEAVRRAIGVLGYRAEVEEILAYCRDHFGIGRETTPPGGETKSAPETGLNPETPEKELVERKAPSKRTKNRDRSHPAE